MNPIENSVTSRREFLKTTGRAAAVSALAGMVIPNVHAAEDNTIQVALIGCGGRGTGAARDALCVKTGPMKLVAMADVFENRLNSSHSTLEREMKNLVDKKRVKFADKLEDKFDVPKERQFIGFDAYKKAMDCLKPGDIAIFTTPLAFRWVHFTYAIEKRLNVFMEKPLIADGPSAKKMLKLGEEASAKNLKVGVGLMSRHKRDLQQLEKRIQDGELGEINFMRGYRMAGPLASAFSTKWPGNPSELLWQISRFHSFIWATGGCYSDFYIHHIDHLCMMKGAWPVKAQALGGRNYRKNPNGELYVDQNFDSYAVEYIFADGARMYIDGRCVPGCNDMYATYAHGTKGSAIVAKSGDCEGPSSIHKGQDPLAKDAIWTSKAPQGEEDPYQNEWNDLTEAIRNDKAYSEVKRGVEASVVTSMGRKAAHTGQELTYDDMLNSPDVYAPNVENWTMDSKAPVTAKEDGTYPGPMPGVLKHHEYAMA